MDLQPALSYLGRVLEVFGIASLLPVFVSWLAADGMAVWFIAMAIGSFVGGTLLERAFKKDVLTIQTTVTIATLSLLVCGVLASIPFFFVTSPVNAILEAFSGITATGLSALEVTALPASLIFWRTFLQWLGGIGLLAAIFLLLDSPVLSAHYLYRRGYDVVGNKSPLVRLRNMLFLFFGFTALGIVLLAAAGLSPFAALLQSMTAISLGGFDNGIPGSAGVNVILVILMILGATSFFLHEKVLYRNVRAYLYSSELRLFVFLAVVFSVLVTLSIVSSPDALSTGIFHAISALTTSGITIAPIVGSSAALLLIAMLIGAQSGSLGGGLKLIRMLILVRGIPWLARRATQPVESSHDVRAGRTTLGDPEIATIALFSVLFLLILIISIILYTLLGLGPFEASFTAVAAQTNTAMSVNPIAGVHDAGKILLIVQMVIGRLELFPIFLLFARKVALHRLKEEETREYNYKSQEEDAEKSPFSFFG
ncbi:MAG: hypothetical protein KKA90_01025 [Nanoarchaeota archaeon]|nr:hypothetical protein [Nanoarchaeota archaeon]